MIFNDPKNERFKEKIKEIASRIDKIREEKS